MNHLSLGVINTEAHSFALKSTLYGTNYLQLYFRYGVKIVLYLNDLMIDENDPENWN